MKSVLSKFATIALLAFVLAPAAFAGDDEAPRTLFSVADLRFSGHGGPVLRGTTLGGEPAFLAGGRGGLIVNDSLSLGFGGCGTGYTEAKAVFEGEEKRIGLGYGGFMAEYYFFPKELVFFSVGCLAGAGSVSDFYYRADDESAFFILEPVPERHAVLPVGRRRHLSVHQRLGPGGLRRRGYARPLGVSALRFRLVLKRGAVRASVADGLPFPSPGYRMMDHKFAVNKKVAADALVDREPDQYFKTRAHGALGVGSADGRKVGAAVHVRDRGYGSA